MRTAAIIPNWNGRKLLEKNLPFVLKVGFDEVIVVDDASEDNSVSYLKTRRSKLKTNLKIIQNKKNKGFPYSVNRGVAAADADIVFLLNLDVKPEVFLIKPVLKDFDDPEVFAVSFNEGKYSWNRSKIEHGFLVHKEGKKTNVAHQTLWVSGGSGAFRYLMWKKLSGMDEIYSPFYWEDVDLSYRALKHGWKLIWEPRAKVFHEHEATINPKNFSKKYLNRIKERNYLIFHWKNLSFSFLFTKHLLGLLDRLRKHPGYFIVVMLALLKLPQIIVRRNSLSMKGGLSDGEILKKFQD